MKKITTIILPALLLLLTGCASNVKDIRVETEANPAVKFSDYKSYTWLGDIKALRDKEGKWQPPKMNITEDIKFLIDRELRKRGLYNYSEDADLAVVFFIGVDMENMNLKTDPNTKQEILENMPAAALVVALVDTKTKFVVWASGATGEIQQNRSEEIIRERLDYAVTEMFKKWPKE